MEAAMSNPFTVLKLWMKFELYEIDSLLECNLRRKDIQKVYDQNMDTASSNLEELMKLERGEMTLGTWWKSKESTQKYQD